MTPTPSKISRVGIVAKSHLRAATKHLTDIEAWLTARGTDAVFETATAALMPASRRPCRRQPALVAAVDLVVVLGGDGTLFRWPTASPPPVRASPSSA